MIITLQDDTRIHIRGWLTHQGKLVTPSTAPAVLAHGDFDAFLRSLAQCQGEFSVVVTKGNETWAAVDRVRSMPLFYANSEKGLLIGEDPYALRSALRRSGAWGAAEAAQLWYLLYVLGDRTLCPKIRQIAPGTAICALRNGDGSRLLSRRYYSYLQEDLWTQDEAALLERLQETLETVFVRMLASVGDRPIVIPLSGGLDSRLCACMLKRLGARNVSAFSYGRPDNPEAQVSREIASQLGLPWHFVSYLDVDWREPELQREFREFTAFSAQLSTLPPVLEDWLALRELKRRGVLDEQSVFCPGHTAGFTAGRAALEAARQAADESQLADLILRKHSPRLHWERPEDELLRQMKHRVIETLGEISRPGVWDPVAAFEGWNWHERQCKRIVNMVRSYEFFGYSWRIPLWDADLMEFWGRLPTSLRQDKTLYRRFLEHNSRRLFYGLYEGAYSPSASAGRSGALRWLRRGYRRWAVGRYCTADKAMERLLTGGCGRYLWRVGRRAVSSEPVTAPWVLLEMLGIEGIWNAGNGAPSRERTARTCHV